MKTVFLSTLFATFFLFLVLGLNAQKLEYKKGIDYVTVKNENIDSLLKPYKDKGKMTERYELKNSNRMKEWFDQVKTAAVPESILEKIRDAGYLVTTLYFNREGKIIDATLQMSSAVYEKLTEEEIGYIYNQLMQARVDMANLSWDGDFIYSYLFGSLKPLKSHK